jgi:hypothetical protein
MMHFMPMPSCKCADTLLHMCCCAPRPPPRQVCDVLNSCLQVQWYRIRSLLRTIHGETFTADIDAVDVWPMLTGTNITTQPRRLTPTTEAVIFDVAPPPTADGAADGQETKWWKLVSASRGPIAVLRAESAGHQGQRHMLGQVPRSFSD